MPVLPPTSSLIQPGVSLHVLPSFRPPAHPLTDLAAQPSTSTQPLFFRRRSDAGFSANGITGSARNGRWDLWWPDTSEP